MSLEGASGQAVRGDSGSSRGGEPGPGGLVIIGSGVVLLIGTFLPYAHTWGIGATTIFMATNGGGFVLWALPLVVSAVVLIGAGIVYVAQNEFARTAVNISIAAATITAIALLLGPGANLLGQSQWGPVSLFPSSDGFGHSLGWGTWIMLIGTIGAFGGAWMAHGELQAVARPRSSSARTSSSAASASGADPSIPRVPQALVGLNSTGPTTGPLPPVVSFFDHDEPRKLIQRMVKGEAVHDKKHGYRIVEAVWLSTAPPKAGVAYGAPDEQYRVKWPGRATVDFEGFRQGSMGQPTEQKPVSASTGVSEAPATPTAPEAARPVEPLVAKRETKMCPDCAEEVFEEARICRYCRHEFTDRAEAGA